MFSDKAKTQIPKLFSETHVQRTNHLKQGPQYPPSTFDSAKKIHSKSPSNHKLSSLSPRRKTLKKTTSRLFQAAHIPLSRQTYLQQQPSKGTEVRYKRPIVRARSSQDLPLAYSLKPHKLDITNQFAIKISTDPSLSFIINQFQEGGGLGGVLAEVLESSGQTLRIDSHITSSAGEFIDI